MSFVFLAIAVYATAGFMCFLYYRDARVSKVAAYIGGVLGSGCQAIAAVTTLVSENSSQIRVAWSIPYGSVFLRLDALSAWFLLIAALVGPLALMYAIDYLDGSKKRVPVHLGFFLLFLASLALVLVAHNAVLFLVFWEIMSVLSCFLLLLEHEKQEIRQAAFIYLIATHLGTAFIIAAVIILGSDCSLLDFDCLQTVGGHSNWALLLALIGFGVKAGFFPLYSWLPEAHPRAPSHISAVLSGVMIKLGIYGILRIISLYSVTPVWWGWLVLCVGLVSGLLGILCSLAAINLKKSLAYSSIENMGIVALGLGFALILRSVGLQTLGALSLLGTMLHLFNHAVFKSLLFLAAGAVLHATGVKEIEGLGGLSKRMPQTCRAFLLGALGITGLPPLSGFLGEAMIYLAAFGSLVSVHNGTAPKWLLAASGVVCIGLALIGGLAVIAFSRLFGITFLGVPRSSMAEKCKEVGGKMILAFQVLSATIVLLPFITFVFIPLLKGPVNLVLKIDPAFWSEACEMAFYLTKGVVLLSALLVGLSLGLRSWVQRLLSRREIGSALTWDCGYLHGTSRMQYSGGSFSGHAVSFFSMLMLPDEKMTGLTGVFPKRAAFLVRTMDIADEYMLRPVFVRMRELFSKLHVLQPRRVHLFALYIIGTLVALIVWNFVVRGVLWKG